MILAVKILEVFKNQGGMKLIKQYARSGVLGTAIAELMILGRNRTSLEILRLSVQSKNKEKLRKNSIKRLRMFENENRESIDQKNSDKVWVCWLQGIENAPLIVKRCYQSVVENLYKHEVVLITEENLSQYVRLPNYIIKKWKSGIITNTHFTDMVRLELLVNYGGLWLDATVFCSDIEDNIPEYFFWSELFFFQCLKPGKDGHALYPSSWLISAKSNNKTLKATLYLLYDYWKHHDYMRDYYLLHCFVSIVLDYYPEEWDKIFPRDNSAPHVLLFHLGKEYRKETWNAIRELTPFHKLTYKLDEKKLDQNNTFYHRIVSHGLDGQ